MELRGTTIIAVQRDGKCAVAGDGQVTMNQANIMKSTAKKVRRIYHDKVIVGFAGSVADAFSLCERFEQKLGQYAGSVPRAGEVIDPDDGIAAIGSGGMYALAAAKALRENTELSAREIAKKSLEIASEICVFTNGNIIVEEV